VKFAVILVSPSPVGTDRLRRSGQRRIPSPSPNGRRRKMYGGRTRTSPQGEPGWRDPIIFASSVLYIPVLLSNIIPRRLPQLGKPQRHADQRVLHRRLLSLHSVVHLLLCLCGLRSPPAGRHHQKQGGYIRHRRVSRPSATSRHPQPDHLAGALFLGGVAITPSYSWRLGASQLPLLRHTLLIAVAWLSRR